MVRHLFVKARKGWKDRKRSVAIPLPLALSAPTLCNGGVESVLAGTNIYTPYRCCLRPIGCLVGERRVRKAGTGDGTEGSGGGPECWDEMLRRGVAA